MTDAHAKAVEAALPAYWEAQRRDSGDHRSWEEFQRWAISSHSVPQMRRHLDVAITAYLAAMRAEGWVLVRDVDDRVVPDSYPTIANTNFAEGWNACRAAMLGGTDDER